MSSSGADEGPAVANSGRTGPPSLQPGYAGRLYLKACATIAFALPVLGPLSSLRHDTGTLLGFSVVVIACVAAVVSAWRRPLLGGILVAIVGTAPFIWEMIMDATGAADPSSRYWAFWFFPGGLVGGALFVWAAFWKAPRPTEAALLPTAGVGAAPVGLIGRLRREAIGIGILGVIGLVFLAILALYPYQPQIQAVLPDAIIYAGFPLLLVGAGVLGYREDGARGAFIAGLGTAVVALTAMVGALLIAGQPVLQVGEGEWIGELFLVAGLMIIGGGFFGLLGGGIDAVLAGLVRRGTHA
jgi:hypothetical protein